MPVLTLLLHSETLSFGSPNPFQPSRPSPSSSCSKFSCALISLHNCGGSPDSLMHTSPWGSCLVTWSTSFIFWPHRTSCGILVPRPWNKPATPAVEVHSLNHRTAREIPWGPHLIAPKKLWRVLKTGTFISMNSKAHRTISYT